MVVQTLVRHADGDPSVAAVMDLGSLPMQRTDEAAQLRRQLDATEIPNVGCWWRSGNDVYFYALASAAEVEDGSNLFTDTLCELIRDIRPAELHAGPFSRVVRDKHVAGQLALVLRKTRTVVHVDEHPDGIDLNGVSSMLWGLLADAMDFDRTQTVTRNLIGTLYALQANTWPRNELFLPLGYRFADDGSRTVVADETPTVRAQTSRLIALAADSTKTLDNIADELAKLGVETRDAVLGRRCLINEAADPPSAVRSLLAHLPTYIDGIYSFFHKNPLQGVDEIADVVVKRDRPDSAGYFQVDLTFGKPSSPWCDPDVIRSAIALRLEDEPAVIDATSLPVPPASWCTDGNEFRLLPRNDRYIVRCRTISTAPFGRNDGQRIASFAPEVMHRALADAVTEALEEGVSSDLGGASATELQRTLDAVEDDRAGAESLGDTFARTGARSTDPEEQRRYEALASEQWAAAAGHRGHAANLRAELALISVDGLAARFSGLAAALEAITREPRPPASITATLRSWIDTITITCEPGAPSATVTMTLRVPTALRSMILGPIAFDVETVGTGSSDKKVGATARTLRDLEQVIQGASAADLAADRDIDGRLGIRLTRMLEDRGATPLAAHAIVTHPLSEVRRALAGMFLDAESPSQQRDYVFDPRWNEHLRTVFGDKEAVGPRRGPLALLHPKGQLLLDHLRENPGITVKELAGAMRQCDGWRDIYAAAHRGWLIIEHGRAKPIGHYDLLCALPEATGYLVDSKTLESVGGVTLPEAYRSRLSRARNLLAQPGEAPISNLPSHSSPDPRPIDLSATGCCPPPPKRGATP